MPLFLLSACWRACGFAWTWWGIFPRDWATLALCCPTSGPWGKNRSATLFQMWWEWGRERQRKPVKKVLWSQLLLWGPGEIPLGILEEYPTWGNDAGVFTEQPQHSLVEDSFHILPLLSEAKRCQCNNVVRAMGRSRAVTASTTGNFKGGKPWSLCPSHEVRYAQATCVL